MEKQERYHEYMLRRSREENAKSKSAWTITVEKDGEELILPFPVELLSQMGWDIGDTLLWEIMNDGQVSIRKKET